MRGTGKEEILKCLDVARIRLATKNKVAQKKCWNQPWFREWLNIPSLKNKYQEWSIRGGQRLGNKFLSFLDIDIEKEDLEEWRKRQLRKNASLLLNYLDCFHVETKKGFHVYLLTDYLLPNSLLYHVDSWLNRKKVIGSIQSKGKYVVGFDSPNKKLVEKGKWFWHIKDINQVKETLEKFFLLVGNQEKTSIESDFFRLQQKVREKSVDFPQNQAKNSFSLPSYSLSRNTGINIRQSRQEKGFIHAKILSKQKTPLLDLWKVFYLDWKSKEKGYFLVNDYQKKGVLPNLDIGETRSIMLVNGWKHSFLSRMI